MTELKKYEKLANSLKNVVVDNEEGSDYIDLTLEFELEDFSKTRRKESIEESQEDAKDQLITDLEDLEYMLEKKLSNIRTDIKRLKD